jgi:repressor LexA
MENLSEKQNKVFKFIRETITETGRPPTIREIGRHFSFASTGTVRDYLKSLVNKGWIKLQKHQARAIELVAAAFRIPIVGRVAAGGPKIAYEDIEGYLELDQLVKNSADLFALRVKGDSMIEAGIMEGDLAIVKKQNSAQGGDLVIALIADEATIKRFRMVNNKFYLEPANNKYKPIPFTEETSIIGKVISVIRKYV